jgi:hypothetical protein
MRKEIATTERGRTPVTSLAIKRLTLLRTGGIPCETCRVVSAEIVRTNNGITRCLCGLCARIESQRAVFERRRVTRR